ncbi:MAG: tRNA lysidine(34) synthetase TilS [Rickettsiales bacterium]|jgi:tRNA(Ile)-lysidine synthase|nr:tRNA lysidine(34) synthetase TilS [Rickettsiales bacterium]
MIYSKFCQDIVTPLKEIQVAVAVSGGSDSVALCILLNRFVKEYGGELHCLTIDHQLRSDSLSEAIKVGEILKKRGVNHQIISWKGKKPKSNIQEEARLARYSLLTEYCHKNNISYLATGHQKNDQAENFIIRLDHGSGVYGLSGIPRIGEFNKIKIIRPLLNFTKQELQEFLVSQNIKWIEDPSNHNEKFTRVKIRNILKQYPEWIDKLATVSDNLSKTKDCIEYFLNKSIKELVEVHSDFVSIKQEGFNELPQEIRFRMLTKLLQEFSSNLKPARGERLENLLAKIKTGKEFKASTLSGCLISRKKDNIIITLEEK